MNKEIFGSWDLAELELLTPGWSEAISRIAIQQSIETVTDGTSITSREAPGASPIKVQVVTGDIVYEQLRWLHELYHGPLRRLAGQFAGYDPFPSLDVTSGININYLSGEGARYERHVDSNPLTGLLFVNTIPPDSGGHLVFEGPDGDVRVVPRAGLFIAFDARQIVHYVSELLGDEPRITVPMNYYLSDADQLRPADLDGYLYTERKDY